MKKTVCIAVDIGASSGRLIAGYFDGTHMTLEEIHRFSNDPVHVGDRYYWDILRIFWEIKQGLRKTGHLAVDSLGIDTWGVDYALFDEHLQLIGLPIHYRDGRNMKAVAAFPLSFDALYEQTGIQHLPFNTVYQLFSDRKLRAAIFNHAAHMLMIPDVLNFFLTRVMKSEYTNATTTQLVAAKTGTWDTALIEKLNFPAKIFKPLVHPGVLYGDILPEIVEKYGLRQAFPVVAVGSHDTASAVAGIPFDEKEETPCFLSLGTWALLGMELQEPIISEKAKAFSFSNEGGVFNTIRFLKNITGTFLLQRLRRAYDNKYSFPDMTEAAKRADKKHFSIDPNADLFVDPVDIRSSIQEYCRKDRQGTPETLGEFAIAIYNGLAGAITEKLFSLEAITDKPISTVHIVGGGIQDSFLCQKLANISGKRMLTGPVESTIMGNILLQLYALGKISSLQEGRRVVKNSIEQKEYLPENACC